jgi:NAD(P)-dependent dehydrogenase (short-subunit alcohol dehydrogenase family)
MKLSLGGFTAGVRTVISSATVFRRDEADFRGKVALITGGSRGLGFLLAREFAQQGCRIAICARDPEELDTARKELERQGAEVFSVTCDITDRQAVERMVRDVTRQFGSVDILVNNAGIIQVGPLASMTVADFQEAMDVMYWGVLYPTLAALPQMQERRSGWIVNITSIGGKLSPPHLLPYNSAKFAAVGLSEGLRAELARDGISVTTVVPGLMRTGSHLNAFFKGKQEREFTWFSLGASLPFLSMDAERAAAQIVSAARRGTAEEILSTPATIAVRFHGVFPGLTTDILGIVNRFLPTSSGPSGRDRGQDVDRRIGSQLLDSLTAFGRSAARRFNQ